MPKPIVSQLFAHPDCKNEDADQIATILALTQAGELGIQPDSTHPGSYQFVVMKTSQPLASIRLLAPLDPAKLGLTTVHVGTADNPKDARLQLALATALAEAKADENDPS
jgi:hypothetical protein